MPFITIQKQIKATGTCWAHFPVYTYVASYVAIATVQQPTFRTAGLDY